MNNIFVTFEFLFFCTLLYSMKNYRIMIIYISSLFTFVFLYLFSFNDHGFDYYSFSDLKFIIFIIPLLFNWINYKKFNKVILLSIIIQFLVSSTLLIDYMNYDFTGTAYKFGVISNLFIIFYLKRYSIMKFFSLIISFLIIHKWLIFYYLYTYHSFKRKNKFFNFTVFFLLISVFYVSVIINFNSFESFIYGRVLGLTDYGDLVLKDGDRFKIWNFYISNSNLIDIPIYGYRYIDIFGNPVHHHNIFIYLISIYSVFFGVILIFFVLKLIVDFYKYSLLITLHLTLLFSTSTVWSNTLFIIGLYHIIGIYKYDRNKYDV